MQREFKMRWKTLDEFKRRIVDGSVESLEAEQQEAAAAAAAAAASAGNSSGTKKQS